MKRKAAIEDFEQCYPAERYTQLLRMLGIPVLMMTDPVDVGRGYADRPSPRVPFWAARVMNWMGLSSDEVEAALRRLVAEPALRATVRDLTQAVRADPVVIAIQSYSFNRDATGQLPSSRMVHVDATPMGQRRQDCWGVRYDPHNGAILRVTAGPDAEPMPLHVAIAVQDAIDRFVHGDAVMHALGSSR